MTNELIWQHLDSAGWEHVRVSDDHPGWTVYDSILVREHNGQVLRGGYTLVTDKQWRTLELRLMMESSPGVMEGVHLLTEGDGRWTDSNENPMPELDGCLDVDIAWTPLTKSLPINRIPLKADEQQELRVASISLPELSIMPVDRLYERVDESHVRYSSRNGTSESIISIDAEGLVIESPDGFLRTALR